MPALFCSGLLAAGFCGCMSRDVLAQGGADMNGIISGFAPPTGQSVETPDLSGLAGTLLAQAVPAKSLYELWLGVTLGVYSTADSYISSLTAAGHDVSDGSRAIAPTIPISTHRTRVNLARVVSRDLGFDHGRMDFTEICDRGVARGLQLCPGEVGFILRAIYQEPVSTSTQFLYIAMQPVIDPQGRKRILFLEGYRSRGRLAALAFPAHAEFPFFAKSEFVFALPD